jgi:GntR family transcriptional regulator
MRIRLSQSSGVPFYRQVQEQLADAIRAGVLASGSPLPSARQLAADLSVSIITVKQAYQGLEAAGLVHSQQGRGTFVAETAKAAAKAHLRKELAAEMDELVRRAAELNVEPDALEAMFTKAMTKSFQRRSR